MPLTILSVAFPFAPVREDVAGGAEQVLLALDKSLCEAGHRSVVVAQRGSRIRGVLQETPACSGSIEQERQQAWRIHAGAVREALRRYKPDIVHYHGLDFQQYLVRTEAPVLVTLHLPAEFYVAGLRPEVNVYYHCVSASQRRCFPNNGFFLNDVENGVDTDFFHPRQGIRRYVACLGRICPEKGFHLALDAARQAEAPLLLAGEVFSYPAHRAYFREEIEPRLGPYRRFVGAVGMWKKRRLLAGAKCLLIPSLVNETSSLVAMEALACGTPVVARPVGALTGIIEHGRTGFFAETVPEIASAIKNCAAIQPAACRATAEARFSLRLSMGRYFELYRQLLAQTVPCSK